MNTGVCYGQLDLPLSSEGEAVVRDRARVGDSSPRVVFCSDLQRAVVTARLLFTDAKLRLDPRLRELSLGEWEGVSWDDIYERDRVRLDAWSADWLAISPPGGETAEDLLWRTASFLADYDRELGDSAVVAHQGSLRALVCAFGRYPASSLFAISFSYLASFSVFDLRHRRT